MILCWCKARKVMQSCSAIPRVPMPLKPMHAVGYEVSGCSLLVMTDGSLMRPEDPANPSVELLPAQ